MPLTEEMRLRPADLSFRVLQADPRLATPQEAVDAIKRFLQRRRAGLAEALEILAGEGEVILRATGEVPHQMLREAGELLMPDWEREPAQETEVDPEQFAIELPDELEEPLFDREILRSRARYFPYPTSEWFEITTGALVLTDARVTYEPEWVMMQDAEEAERSGLHVIPIDRISRCWRGDWWDIPCLMIEIPERTYRYGWPSERGEPETVFDVDAWLVQLRSMLAERE